MSRRAFKEDRSSKEGFLLPPDRTVLFEHFVGHELKGITIDPYGNVWTINNWKLDFDIDITSNPGGDGMVIFVGLARPPRQ
jgi:hypothetical protein